MLLALDDRDPLRRAREQLQHARGELVTIASHPNTPASSSIPIDGTNPSLLTISDSTGSSTRWMRDGPHRVQV